LELDDKAENGCPRVKKRSRMWRIQKSEEREGCP